MLRNRIALTFALTRVRFSLPFRAAVAMHLGSSVLWLASVPQKSYVSTASGIDSQPSSTHLASLDLYACVPRWQRLQTLRAVTLASGKLL